MRPAARIASIALLFVCTTLAAAADPPHWIGPATDDAPTFRLARTIELDAAVQRAAVRLAADFGTATLLVNGEPALVVEPYCQTQDMDVTPWIRRGKNELVIVVNRVPGPTTVACSFVAEYQDRRRVEIVTDEDWTCVLDGKSQPAADLGAVRPELWGIDRRAAVVSPFENYEQWKQTLDKGKAPQTKFDTAPGFAVTTLRNAGPDEGSWIAMAFDADGRLTISREDKGLLRMTIADDRRSVARVEPIDVELKECRGLIYDHGFLYANANNSKAMYRLKIEGSGEVKRPEQIREFPGDVGHGRNDLAFGPRGELYSMHGDSVLPPGEPLLDRTSPLRESRQGPPRKEAYLLRTDRGGKKWELVCTGLRNPYGVAVHPNGDLFTYDADNEFDMGTPWYRPTRIVQMMSGADYGYRAAKDQWTPNFPDHPDNGLPLIDVGRGSPTAAMFGTNLQFPPSYRDALYVLDWSYGRVLAVHLTPRGGGYRAALEVFLQGRPLNVTDIAAGPDGAMYLITGGRKTQSALYRVEFTGPIDTAPAESQHEQDAAKFAERQRTVRKKLEKYHGAAKPKALNVAWRYLSDADPTIRHAARIAVEQLPVESWRSRCMEIADDGLTQHAAWMMLSRTGDATNADEFLDRLLAQSTDQLDLAARYELLFLLRQCREQIADLDNERRNSIVKKVLALQPTTDSATRLVSRYGDGAEFRRRTALLLGELQADEAIRFAAPLFASAVQEDRLMGLLALRDLKQGWTPETRRRYFEVLNDASRFVGGQGMPTFVDRIRKDALATLSEKEREQLAEMLKPAAIIDEPLPPLRKKVRTWTLGDLSEVYAEGATGGDAKRGEVLFRDALCSRCHRAGLSGPAVGPDLTFVARRFSRHDMLESIVTPSLAVAEQYRNAQVVTTGGQVYVGRVLSEGDFRSEKLLLNVDPLHPSKVVTIDKKEIDDYRLTETSPMPQGLLDSFTLDEICDLLAFMEANAGR